MGWLGKPEWERLDFVLRSTQNVRIAFHGLRNKPGSTAEDEIAIVDQAELRLAEEGFNEDERLAAGLRFAQYRAGILAIHRRETAAAEAACFALLDQPPTGPVSKFMQARIGMVMLADAAVNCGGMFPREQFQRYWDTVTALPARPDDEFWFFATLHAYKQGWVDVLESALAKLMQHWEDSSGQYLAKRTILMLNLLCGSATEADCGAALQAVNQPLFIAEFTRHLLADCDRSGLMTPATRRIWTERRTEFIGLP